MLSCYTKRLGWGAVLAVELINGYAVVRRWERKRGVRGARGGGGCGDASSRRVVKRGGGGGVILEMERAEQGSSINLFGPANVGLKLRLFGS